MKKLIFIGMVSLFLLSFTNSYELQDRMLVEIDAQNIQGIGRVLAEGADINGLSSTGFTPLLYAVVRQKPISIDYLLSQGARPDFRGRSGLSPFSVAKSSGDDKLFKKLYAALETLGEVDPSMIELEQRVAPSKKESPTLIKCVIDDRFAEFSELIVGGADVNYTDSEKSSALLYAAFFGRVDYVRVLVDSGAKVDQQDKDGYSALMLATVKGFLPIVEILVEADANLNLKNSSGQTALMFAASIDRSDIVALLIKSGASLDILDKDGFKFYSYGAKKD
ncbi:MAG: ankyrin repeat domain-containing protein [Spirochaetales bacterium]|nr:ankyrin repeat domain-containing protein [Spirochaetales bacterium]